MEKTGCTQSTTFPGSINQRPILVIILITFNPINIFLGYKKKEWVKDEEFG